MKKYVVELEAKERAELEALTRKGRASARRIKRALILLAAAEGETDEAIAARVRVHPNTVQRIRQRFAEESLRAALSERPRPGKARKLAGPEEAFVIALACTDPPEGRQTMQLLADRLVELQLVVRVIDGDTIDVLIDGVRDRVRYFGLDTPERGQRCYAEATARNQELVSGQTVLLLPDVRKVDVYDRLLRYVILPDGTFVNATLVAEGYATAWTRDGAFKSRIMALQNEADRLNRCCLWR